MVFGTRLFFVCELLHGCLHTSQSMPPRYHCRVSPVRDNCPPLPAPKQHHAEQTLHSPDECAPSAPRENGKIQSKHFPLPQHRQSAPTARQPNPGGTPGVADQAAAKIFLPGREQQASHSHAPRQQANTFQHCNAPLHPMPQANQCAVIQHPCWAEFPPKPLDPALDNPQAIPTGPAPTAFANRCITNSLQHLKKK